MKDDQNADLIRTIRKGSKTFFLASFFLTPKSRVAAYKYYAWCRYCDDQIDKAPTQEEATRRLIELKQKTQQVLQSQITSHPGQDDKIFFDLSIIAQTYSIPSHYFFDLLRGLEMDVQGRRYESLNDLIEYCYCVAGTVGLVMATILDARGREALNAACSLGVAMQLTNIARDVREDFDNGRMYIPKSLLANLSNSSEAVQNYFLATQALLRKADFFYERGLSGIKFLPRRSAMAISAAAFLYRAIGLRVLTLGVSWWHTRAIVSPAMKFFLVMHSLRFSLKRLLRKSFKEPPLAFQFESFNNDLQRLEVLSEF